MHPTSVRATMGANFWAARQRSSEKSRPSRLIFNDLEKETFIVKTMHGLEPVLAAEIEGIGGADVQPLKRAVSFVGDRALMYRANYELRTALRVLWPIHSFHARDERQFYARVRDEVDWSYFMDVSGTLAVDAVVQSETFRHSQYMALTVKDAIVDQFRDRFGSRPDVNTVVPDIRIHLRIHENKCDLLLDASGDSLHKRGYRRDQLDAPINEVLAAGMLQLSGWDGTGHFVDPMCGSGTIPIEAAMLARRIAPQKHREFFGFFRWKDFDKKLWQKVKAEADAREQAADCQIFASDKDSRARNATSINALAAGVENDIHISKTSFETLEPPAPTGVLMTNPPYDERLKIEEVEAFYAMIGSRFKHHWQGWSAWVISSNRAALHKIGLKTSKRHQLFNGAFECFFNKYELYQ